MDSGVCSKTRIWILQAYTYTDTFYIVPPARSLPPCGLCLSALLEVCYVMLQCTHGFQGSTVCRLYKRVVGSASRAGPFSNAPRIYIYIYIYNKLQHLLLLERVAESAGFGILSKIDRSSSNRGTVVLGGPADTIVYLIKPLTNPNPEYLWRRL